MIPDLKTMTVCLKVTMFVVLATSCVSAWGQTREATIDPTLPARLHMALANQPTGLLVPLYLYPANVHTNAAYNRLMELKLSHPRTPVCVIVNPASGPGAKADGNYKYAIRRLRGAGCVVLGYVSTRYAKQPLDEVKADILKWRELYETVDGVFLDEQTSDDEQAHLEYYEQATRFAHERGYWPVFANPGAPQVEPYFQRPTADVIVIHENAHFPEEADLRGDYFGGYADYPPYRRAALVHSMAELDREKLASMIRLTRWIYVTDDRYLPGEKGADNPWDSLSRHTPALFEALER